MNAKRIALAAGLILTSPVTMAAVSDADFQAMKDSVAALTQKLADMEKDLAAEKAKTAQAATANTAAPPVATKPAASSWADKVALQGDFRYRYDTIDQENADNRNRQRIRARAAIIAKPVDKVEVGMGLSTSENGDPVSANQTLGNGASRKDVFVDLAYFNWTAAEGLNLMGGKFLNNLYRPSKYWLVWDNDLNPEGLGLSYVNGPFFANVLAAWIESDSAATSGDAVGLGGQAGVMWSLNDAVKLTAGAGYFALNTKGKGAFYTVPGKAAKFYGNSVDISVDPNGLYIYNYNELEGFAELGFQLFGQPASLFANYVQNTDADAFDTGWAAGVSLGVAKAKGSWEVKYAYQDLERDAVFGLWTDSDFGGGGTDTRGHVFRGAYALTDRTNLAFSYFLTQFGENAGNELDYNRLQLDANFRY